VFALIGEVELNGLTPAQAVPESPSDLVVAIDAQLTDQVRADDVIYVRESLF
jgi:hypothetical protein